MKKWMLPLWCGLMVALGMGAALIKGAALMPLSYYEALERQAVLLFEPDDAPTELSTLVPPPDGAVDVCINGVPVCTAESYTAATGALSELLMKYGQAPEGETLVSAAFLQRVTIAPAQNGEQVLSQSAVVALLDDPGLCPVERVTRIVTTEAIPFEQADTEKDKRLPKGTRLILTVGRQGAAQTETNNISVNGVEKERAPVASTGGYAPIMEAIALGAYSAAKPEREPGRSEGVTGPDFQAELMKPVEKGAIVSNFGTRENRMHYGVDYDAAAGTAVLAPLSGVVIFAGERGSYGGVVDIDHGEGLVTRLARLTNITLAPGDKVETGAPLGVVMEPEEDEPPLLHLETLMEGIPYNPRQYLKSS